MKRFILAPSMIASDFLHLDQVIAACERAGADWLHVDVMDGRFVPNITVGPFVVEHLRRATKLPLDVHLMIEEPERYLEDFAKAGASNLTVHVETCPQLEDTLDIIKKLGCKAGVTLNPATPVSEIEPVLGHADLVLVLSVNPGFSGQEFMPETIAKVEQVRKKLDELGLQAFLEVDGGINEVTLPLMRKAGADTFVAGHAVFGNTGRVSDAHASDMRAAGLMSAGAIEAGIRALRLAGADI
jgi:ribulose-phosphate 3-epimerase